MSNPPKNTFDSFCNGVFALIVTPVEYFREKVVVPNQQNYPWYHEKFPRVPTIDQCYEDDAVCIFEADQQFKRDRRVESEIVSILRQRFEDCVLYETPDHEVKCQKVLDEYNEAATNWFIKYGDLGAFANAKRALMKQKHRMVWERRYGPVGTGMNKAE